MSYIIDKLQNFDYYASKLPLWLQESDNFKAHLKIWFDVLVSEIGFGDQLLEAFDIFNPDYSTEGKDDFLEKLAAIFDFRRRFRIIYKDGDNVSHDEYITLNNTDLLILIKCQIIKNYFDGSHETINKFYDSTPIKIYYKTFAQNQATVWLSEDSAAESSENILAMFYAGLLTIESVGIEYRRSVILINLIMTWGDDYVSNPTSAPHNVLWDKGRWTS